MALSWRSWPKNARLRRGDIPVAPPGEGARHQDLSTGDPGTWCHRGRGGGEQELKRAVIVEQRVLREGLEQQQDDEAERPDADDRAGANGEGDAAQVRASSSPAASRTGPRTRKATATSMKLLWNSHKSLPMAKRSSRTGSSFRPPTSP